MSDSHGTLYRPTCCGRPWPLSKGARPKPATTNVGRYVAGHAPAVALRLAKILAIKGKSVAEHVSMLYATRLQKDDAAARRARIIEELDLDDLGDIEGELEGPMLAAFKRAAAIGAVQVHMPVDTNQVDRAAVAFAKRRGGDLIKDLAGTTRDAMRGLLERAVEEGMSVGMLADAIRALGAFSESRADTIATTELAFAHVRGNVHGWRASGEVEGKRWLLADTHDEPDECDEAAAAGVVGLDEEFAPGIDFPPAHSRCCCDIAPVLRERLERAHAGSNVDLRKLLDTHIPSSQPPARTSLSDSLKTRLPPTTQLGHLRRSTP